MAIDIVISGQLTYVYQLPLTPLPPSLSPSSSLPPILLMTHQNRLGQRDKPTTAGATWTHPCSHSYLVLCYHMYINTITYTYTYALGWVNSS